MLESTGSVSRISNSSHLCFDKHHRITILEFDTNQQACSFVLNLLKQHNSYTEKQFIEVEYIEPTKIEVTIFYSLESVGENLLNEIEINYYESKRNPNVQSKPDHWWTRFFN